MNLNEAKQILSENGFIVERGMSIPGRLATNQLRTVIRQFFTPYKWYDGPGVDAGYQYVFKDDNSITLIADSSNYTANDPTSVIFVAVYIDGEQVYNLNVSLDDYEEVEKFEHECLLGFNMYK